MERDRAIEVVTAAAKRHRSVIEVIAQCKDDCALIDEALAALEESPKRPTEAKEYLEFCWCSDCQDGCNHPSPYIRIGAPRIRYRYDGLVPPPSGQEATKE